MKKYLRLGCTVCRRQVDKLVDLTHYAPDRCTITLGCEGRLQPIEYRSSGGIAVTPEVGVTDWRPRGSDVVTGTKVTKEPDLINLETGPRRQLTIAAPTNKATLNVTMVVKSDTPKTYRQYVYRKEGRFTSISGVESGLEKKALRFKTYGTSPDQVEVFVDGVKREQGTGPAQYQIYDGSDVSSAPPNTILFNTALDSQISTQVDVIVSKVADATTIILPFKRHVSDESRTGAFENVSYVERLVGSSWKKFYLYSLDVDDISTSLNTILTPVEMDAFFVLARKPYSHLDRYTDTVVPLTGLSDADFIKYYTADRVPTARITETALNTFFPPMRLNKFIVEKTIRTALEGVEQQFVIDGKVITGPDA